MHLPIAAGVVAVAIAVSTYYQGDLVERWHDYNIDPALERMAERVGKTPLVFGDWEGEVRPDTDETRAAYRKAGVKEHIDINYRNIRTGKLVSVTLVCGIYRKVSHHTPDQCMPAAGFKVADEERRRDVALADGTKARYKTSQFVKQGEQTINQRMMWMWTNEEEGKWIAPKNDRWGLVASPLWYKLYVTVPLPGVEKIQDVQDGEAFMQEFLPELNKVLLAPAESAEPAGDDAA